MKNVNDFEWISQLRYYWHDDWLHIQAVNAEFPYGFEYLGNSGRLVITPLTDRSVIVVYVVIIVVCTGNVCMWYYY